MAEHDDSARSNTDTDTAGTDDRLAPFNPTCEEAQLKAIELLSLTDDDILFDLGCGDARILITAASRMQGVRCVGVEIDPVFVERANESVALLPKQVRDRVDIRQHNLITGEKTYTDDTAEHGDLCQNLDLANDATAIYMFLLPKGLARLKQQVLDNLVECRAKQRRPLRIVTYMFQVHGWKPVLVDDSTKGNIKLYLYEFGS